eukprot:768693-Hanusia_phi.AAC.13
MKLGENVDLEAVAKRCSSELTAAVSPADAPDVSSRELHGRRSLCCLRRCMAEGSRASHRSSRGGERAVFVLIALSLTMQEGRRGNDQPLTQEDVIVSQVLALPRSRARLIASSPTFSMLSLRSLRASPTRCLQGKATST